MIAVKGRSRDTAWFAMIDRAMLPAIRAAYDVWLDPANFDATGAAAHAAADAVRLAPVVVPRAVRGRPRRCATAWASRVGFGLDARALRRLPT